MHLKKAIVTPKSRELSLKNKAVLAPVMDFNKKNKKEEDLVQDAEMVENVEGNKDSRAKFKTQKLPGSRAYSSRTIIKDGSEASFKRAAFSKASFAGSLESFPE